MTEGTLFNIDWICAVRESKTVRKKIRKRFLGIRYWGWHEKRFPKRTFDTRQGDTIPAKVTSYERQLSLQIGVRRMYIYPGEELEMPDFDHLVGRRELNVRETLMCMFELFDGTHHEMALEHVKILHDENQHEPTVHLVYLQKVGFLVFDGYRPQSATVTFRDDTQRRELVTELFGKNELEEVA